MQAIRAIKQWWAAYKAEKVRVRALCKELDNLTDYGLLDRIQAGEKAGK